MNNVFPITPGPPTIVGDGGGPYDPGMERRVAKLEDTVGDVRERLVRIETKVESVAEHGSTKADLHTLRADIASMESRLIRWFIATAAGLAGIAFLVARYMG